MANKKKINKFPSPYGVTVIKSRKDNMTSQEFYEFPSPYGVTVIKSYGNQLIDNGVARFRPLMG